MSRRRVIAVWFATACLACDTMIADRWVIRSAADQSGQSPSASEILATARVALDDCALAANAKIIGDTLVWRDPEKPPGLHVMVRPSSDGLRVTLAQDLYGPVGPTDAYRCVQKSLRSRLEARYGKGDVRLESNHELPNKELKLTKHGKLRSFAA